MGVGPAPVGFGNSPEKRRLMTAVVARTRAWIGVPASSAWNSPICHWRVSIQSGSNTRALEPVPMSASVHCGSRRVQLVMDDVVGAPENVVFPPGGTTIGGCGCTATGCEISPVVPKVSMARIVSVCGWSGGVGGKGSVIRNCDQLPVMLTAFAN
jgi:hypothetical protein